jgi:hypothetical protein
VLFTRPLEQPLHIPRSPSSRVPLSRPPAHRDSLCRALLRAAPNLQSAGPRARAAQFLPLPDKTKNLDLRHVFPKIRLKIRKVRRSPTISRMTGTR